VPSSLQLHVHVSYINPANEYITHTHTVALPLDICARVIPPVKFKEHAAKSASTSTTSGLPCSASLPAATIEVNRPKLPPLHQLFPDLSAVARARFPPQALAHAHVLSLQFSHMPAHATLIASRHNPRIRVVSSHPAVFAVVLQELSDRMALFYRYNPDYSTDAATGATNTDPLRIRMLESPDTAEFTRLINLQHRIRTDHVQTRDKLDRMSRQLMAVQKRLLARSKDKAGTEKKETVENKSDIRSVELVRYIPSSSHVNHPFFLFSNFFCSSFLL
jgi:hypothetical protein